MSDRKKVIEGLEHCHNRCFCDEGCPYHHILIDPNLGIDECTSQLAQDALELLKEQDPKPRVLTLEEAIETLTKEGGFVWIEEKSHPREKSKVFATSYLCDNISRRYEDYGKEFVPYRYSYRWLWRCWDAFPNNEQREAVKWHG